MKKLIVFIFFTLIGAVSFAQESSLFDYDGNATAYIANDSENTIYLWNGIPVAYVFFERDEYHIYGFNGQHLGWFDNGVVRDNNGYAIGATQRAHPRVTLVEPVKSVKRVKPVASVRRVAPVKPVFSMSWGGHLLVQYCHQDLDKRPKDYAEERSPCVPMPPMCNGVWYWFT
ncbi:hypothetical protein FACS189485_10210 [Spirochaetia bacterium]|nr:hypothetical protein FACS189485_10210 [Spirochaetia bacterium]